MCSVNTTNKTFEINIEKRPVNNERDFLPLYVNKSTSHTATLPKKLQLLTIQQVLSQKREIMHNEELG
jgi:hypothetical protein